MAKDSTTDRYVPKRKPFQEKRTTFRIDQIDVDGLAFLAQNTPSPWKNNQTLSAKEMLQSLIRSQVFHKAKKMEIQMQDTKDKDKRQELKDKLSYLPKHDINLKDYRWLSLDDLVGLLMQNSLYKNLKAQQRELKKSYEDFKEKTEQQREIYAAKKDQIKKITQQTESDTYRINHNLKARTRRAQKNSSANLTPHSSANKPSKPTQPITSIDITFHGGKYNRVTDYLTPKRDDINLSELKPDDKTYKYIRNYINGASPYLGYKPIVGLRSKKDLISAFADPSKIEDGHLKLETNFGVPVLYTQIFSKQKLVDKLKRFSDSDSLLGDAFESFNRPMEITYYLINKKFLPKDILSDKTLLIDNVGVYSGNLTFDSDINANRAFAGFKGKFEADQNLFAVYKDAIASSTEDEKGNRKIIMDDVKELLEADNDYRHHKQADYALVIAVDENELT